MISLEMFEIRILEVEIPDSGYMVSWSSVSGIVGFPGAGLFYEIFISSADKSNQVFVIFPL
jgi:hypothetical protein